MTKLARSLEYVCYDRRCKSLRLSCHEHCPACGEPRFIVRFQNGSEIAFAGVARGHGWDGNLRSLGDSEGAPS
jgi:hypothetical protein